MQAISYPSLLQIVTFVIFIFNSQFTYSYASTEDENTINKIFETHGKDNVVNYILHKNNRKITIQKKKSFLSVSGRPDISLVTAKSINYDLGNLKIDISNLKSELDAYIEIESKKQQKKDDRLSKSASVGDENGMLSRKLEYKIKDIRSKYKATDNAYERRRLKKELSKLQRKYDAAKYNEKYKTNGNSTDKSSRNSRAKTKRSGYYCNDAKAQLQKLTTPAYRHQIFFCNDRSYRAKNPKSCGKYKYSREYSLPEYKDKVRQLRQTVSNQC